MQTVMRQTLWLLVSSRFLPPSCSSYLSSRGYFFFRGGRGETGVVSLFLCFSFYCWILCFKEEAYFLFPVFCSETLCPAFALHVTWEMAEHSRQQSCSFHLSFGEDEHWVFGKQISGWLDLFQMGSITQGPNLSSGNDSFTFKVSLGYSFWEGKTS